MSFGAGGLAQMTFNHNSLNGGLNMSSSSGLSSRGANMKRLSIMTPAPSEEVAQAPKSSRAQLLSGLRTAPRNASAVPDTAPATQSQFPINKRHPSPPAQQKHLAVPQTAMASSFAQAHAQAAPRGHRYTPSQVMSPPAITLEADEAEAQLDPNYYQQLLAMNNHLVQQQERLKQQLIMVTQQAQQMGLTPEQAQYYAQMMAQQAGLYNQQLQQAPIIEPVANQPGLFMVHNPMTGQTQYVYDQNSAQLAYGMEMGINDQNLSHSPPPATPTYKAGFEPPTNNHAKSNNWRSNSPPKHTPSPPRDEPMALPPPSANAYRPGHKKTTSVMPAAATAAAATPTTEVPTKIANNGNFGGQAREGEHPTRQPRGPPALDELIAKPTSKIEGSKNFATRQRRAALNNIISAAGARRSCGNSNASLSPTSERDELVFSSAEDNDTASIRSGGSAQRAIGSEKKEREERESRERERKNSASSGNNDETSLAEKLNALNMGHLNATADSKEKRRSAVLLVKGAGQRRSMMY